MLKCKVSDTEMLLDESLLDPILSRAATAGDINFVRLCFAHGQKATTHRYNKRYHTALAHIAAKALIAMARLWIEHGASVKDSGAIIAAAAAGGTDMVEFLLEKGADTNEDDLRVMRGLPKSKKYGSALYQAVRKGHRNVEIKLEKKGADWNQRNWKGMTPLSLAKEMDAALARALQNCNSTM